MAVAVLGASLVLPAGAFAQSGSVEECIANNGPRYNTPEDATTHQYVDAGGLCADAQDDDTQVDIAPIGGGQKPKPRRTTTQPPASGTPALAPARSTRTIPQAPPVPATAPEPAEPAASPPTAKPKPTPAARQGARGAAATATVTAALTTGEQKAGLSSGLSLGSAPGGVLIALLAGAGLAGAGAGMRRINRR